MTVVDLWVLQYNKQNMKRSLDDTPSCFTQDGFFGYQRVTTKNKKKKSKRYPCFFIKGGFLGQYSFSHIE